MQDLEACKEAYHANHGAYLVLQISTAVIAVVANILMHNAPLDEVPAMVQCIPAATMQQA